DVPCGLRSLEFNRKLYDVVKFSTDIGLFSRTRRAIALDELALDTGLELRLLELLLDVLIRSGFMICQDGKSFLNTPMSQAYLDEKSPYYIGDDILDGADTYDVLSSFVNEGPPQDRITTDFWTPEFVKTIGSRSLLGPVHVAVDKVDLAGRRKMLDVGGGHGLYSILFTKKYKGLEAWVLDLPSVVEATRENVEKTGSGEGVHVIAADFDHFKPDTSYDVVFSSNFAGSPEGLDLLLRRAKDLLEDGGWLVLRNYASDVRDGAMSSLIALDRYARRGESGLTTGYIAATMEGNGFRDVVELYRGDGAVVLKGIKK